MGHGGRLRRGSAAVGGCRCAVHRSTSTIGSSTSCACSTRVTPASRTSRPSPASPTCTRPWPSPDAPDVPRGPAPPRGDPDLGRDPRPSSGGIRCLRARTLRERRRARPDRAGVHRRQREVPDVPDPDDRAAARERRPDRARGHRAGRLGALSRRRGSEAAGVRRRRRRRPAVRRRGHRRPRGVPGIRGRLHSERALIPALPRRPSPPATSRIATVGPLSAMRAASEMQSAGRPP